MGGGEGGNLGSEGEVPGRIFNIVPPERLCQAENDAPAGVAVFP